MGTNIHMSNTAVASERARCNPLRQRHARPPPRLPYRARLPPKCRLERFSLSTPFLTLLISRTPFQTLGRHPKNVPEANPSNAYIPASHKTVQKSSDFIFPAESRFVFLLLNALYPSGVKRFKKEFAFLANALSKIEASAIAALRRRAPCPIMKTLPICQTPPLAFERS